MFVCSECGYSQPIDGACSTDGTRLVPIGDDVLLGTTIGAYRVARLLGIGGMGRVYKGVHPTIGSRVAIKVLSRECTDRRDLVERFFAEAKAVNLIRHESIVNILDLAMLADGRPYIIMEYLDGAPLASIIEHALLHRQPLPLGGLARLAAEVLDALGAAHAKFIVHRDLKPDNIFVAPSGRPKVLDFGIAKLSDPGSSGGRATRTGSLLGTPQYMAPEQAAGLPVDHRADLYAMGVILYECVTGQKPFVAESLYDLLRKHVEEPPPPPRSIRPDLDVKLEQLILCALAKSPDHRFTTAHAMSTALQHATAQLPPEQWVPITGSGTHRAIPSGGWQPTPQSWGPQAVPPRPSEQALPNGQSTVSASSGQVQHQGAHRRSNKALWIALAGATVIGGVVTIAVVGSRPEPTITGDAPQPPDMKHDAVAKPGKLPVKSASKASAKSPGAGDDDLVADVVEATNDLPPEVKKQIHDAIGTGPTTSGNSTPSKSTDAWIEDSVLTPAGWNPKRVEVAGFVRFALAAATKAMPDAQLTRISVTGATPDGFANLELPSLASPHGNIELRFVSPSHSTPKPGTPGGLPIDLACEFRIQGDPNGVEISPMFKSNCKEQIVPPPRCDTIALWKLARARKAPANSVANINYYRASMHKRAFFFFDIGFGTDLTYSEMFSDADCP